MKNRSRAIARILIKWLQGLLELLAVFPIIFTIGILLIPEEVWIWIASLSVLHLIGLFLGKYLSGKPRYAHFGIGLLITVFAAWIASNNIYAMGLILVSGLPVFDRGIRFRGLKWVHMFPTAGLWIGLIIYLIGGIVYSLSSILGTYFPYLAWAGLSYMIITLFTVNSEQLKAASLPGEETTPALSSTILKNNRVMVLLTMAVVMIISYFNQLRDGVTRLAKKLFRFIVEIIVFLSNLLYQPSTGTEQPPGQGPMEMFPDEVNEPSWILKALEVVAVAIVGIVILILLWYGIKVICRLLKKIYKYLTRILKDRISFHEETGFIDEKESLMGFADLGKDYVDRFQKWIQKLMEKEPKWEDLVDNHQRIRFLYRKLLLKCMGTGYSYKNYMTPKETGRDIMSWDKNKNSKIEDLTVIYDNIRYGQGEVKDSKVQELAETFLNK